MKPKKVIILVDIEERNGEQEYTFHSVLECLEGQENATAEHLAANWYDRDEEEGENPKQEDGYYEHLGGCILARVKQWQRITARDKATLSRLGVAY